MNLFFMPNKVGASKRSFPPCFKRRVLDHKDTYRMFAVALDADSLELLKAKHKGLLYFEENSIGGSPQPCLYKCNQTLLSTPG